MGKYNNCMLHAWKRGRCQPIVINRRPANRAIFSLSVWPLAVPQAYFSSNHIDAIDFIDRHKGGKDILVTLWSGYWTEMWTDRVLVIEQRMNQGRVEVGLDALASYSYHTHMHFKYVGTHCRVSKKVSLHFERLSLEIWKFVSQGHFYAKINFDLSDEFECVKPLAFGGKAYALLLKSWHQWELYAAPKAWQGCRGEGVMQEIESILISMLWDGEILEFHQFLAFICSLSRIKGYLCMTMRLMFYHVRVSLSICPFLDFCKCSQSSSNSTTSSFSSTTSLDHHLSFSCSVISHS